MSQVKDILEGHLNELLNKKEKLSASRLAICIACPIASQTALGLMCDSRKWINKNNETASEDTPGFTRGCGCRMSAKTTLEQAHCIIDKW
jgi:hypothetical protein